MCGDVDDVSGNSQVEMNFVPDGARFVMKRNAHKMGSTATHNDVNGYVLAD